jgi:hypothetical protein
MPTVRPALLGALFTVVSLSYGGSIYFTNFGADSVGNLVGQDGWAAFNGSSSFANVENAFTDGTPQAAELGPFDTSSVQTGIYHTDTASGSPLIDLNADIYLFSSSQENQWQFAGLAGPSLAPFIGGIDLVPDNPDLGTTDTIHAITLGYGAIGTFTLNAWHNVDFLFNFSTQTYTVSLDGVVLAANLAFCTDNGPCTTGGTIAEGQFQSFFDVFATLHANAGDDLSAVDNWSLSSVDAPEPATYGLTGLALLTGAFLRRRR